MTNFLNTARNEAKRIVAELPAPAFYDDCDSEVEFSRKLFFQHPVLARLQEDALNFLYDETRFGIIHAKNVAIDACAIVLVEGQLASADENRHLALLAQISGMLHDISLHEEEPSIQNSEAAAVVLRQYDLTDRDRKLIDLAISHHEWGDFSFEDDYEAELLCGAVHDADKFRWGPDIFSTAFWKGCNYQQADSAQMIKCFEQSFGTISDYRDNFKTICGRSYGSELLEFGENAGTAILEYMKRLAAVQLD
ncbi:MAG: hypothetical protein ACNI27_00485 [Desulfovibrio sp.]